MKSLPLRIAVERSADMISREFKQKSEFKNVENTWRNSRKKPKDVFGLVKK